MGEEKQLRSTLNGWLLQPAGVIATSHLLEQVVRKLPGFEQSRIARQLGRAAAAQGQDRLELLLRDGLVAGTLEELFFRGLLFEVLRRQWGIRAAIVGSALCFALAHLDPHQVLVAGLLGIQLGALRQVHGLAPAMLAHVANNLLAFGSAAGSGQSGGPIGVILALAVSSASCVLLARDLRAARTGAGVPAATLQRSIRSDE